MLLWKLMGGSALKWARPDQGTQSCVSQEQN